MVMTFSRRADAIRVSIWDEPASLAVEPLSYAGPDDRRGNRDEAMLHALRRLLDLPADARAWLGGLMFEAADDGRVRVAVHDGRGYRREVLAVGPDGYARRAGIVVVEEL